MVELEPVEAKNDYKDLRRHAIILLTRREHSAKELLQKLVTKGYDSERVISVIDDLVAEGLQSDTRFAESYMRYRRNKGFGPIHIQLELQQRGVAHDIIESIVDAQDQGWLEYLERARKKRFGQELPQVAKDRTTQSRFLAYRGFSSEQIASVLSDDRLY